ncbi:MAG: Sb-PDE family phosphodiesterase [bacterium]
MKTNALTLLVFLFCGFSAFSQARMIRTGEVPGYVTLKCDFHTHTIFSDGEVWPTFRIREAVEDGLDAIAITDHLEYHPKQSYVKGDDNSAFAIARKSAELNNLLLVRGTEVTRRMPPGHLNLLFLPDSIVFEDTTFLKVIEKAVSQGAFVQWNHPGWIAQQPDGVARMLEIHRELIRKGWLHGIEIYNDENFYPGVMEWCADNNLAIIGNTDVHGTTYEVMQDQRTDHRVMTLVFAKDKSIPSLKEALFAGRTLVWYGDTLAGEKEWAEPFVRSSLKVTVNPAKDKKSIDYRIDNPTDIPFHLTDGGNPDAPKRIDLPARSYRIIRLKKEGDQKLVYTVSNVKTGTGELLKIQW